MAAEVFVIAEAGVNHNGDIELARALIDAAADSGADAVKFQTFQADELVSHDAPKAAYQQRTTDRRESQHAMIRRLELDGSQHEALIAHASIRGIRFLSTPFDRPSLQLLTTRLGLDLVKVGSGELTNAPFLIDVARAAERLIVSTGMGNLSEVESALAALAYGFTAPHRRMPGANDLAVAYGAEAGQMALRSRVTLLHCTTEYPAAFEDVNLGAISTLSTAFGLPVGYSDHTLGTHIPVAAVAAGACVIEKHLTLDRTLPGPDHAASLEPDELAQMVIQIRQTQQAIGDGIKRPSEAEWRNRAVARKSLVAARPIALGELFTVDNLTCKRPGTGIAPDRFWSYLGRASDHDYDTDELIR